MIPQLKTERLAVRPFALDDLDAVYRLLDVELGEADTGADKRTALAKRRQWLQWTVLSYEELARMRQPPYGDRALTLRATGELIGACGYAPVLAPLAQLPGLNAGEDEQTARRFISEVGLYWAISPAHQGQGYATEAGRALIDYAFAHLNLRRIVATTSYDNDASTGVMRKLGMRIERNPFPEPFWLQIVGVLEYEEWRNL
jgi:[ribosomal protein S5]-alanine N-acetyltransferase